MMNNRMNNQPSDPKASLFLTSEKAVFCNKIWKLICQHEQSAVNLATCANFVAPVNFSINFLPLFCQLARLFLDRIYGIGDRGWWGRMKDVSGCCWVEQSSCSSLPSPPHPRSQVGDFIGAGPCQKLWYHSHQGLKNNFIITISNPALAIISVMHYPFIHWDLYPP